MRHIEAMYNIDKDELEDIVRELGMVIEEGDPQTIADVWLYKVKPYVHKALASISTQETK